MHALSRHLRPSSATSLIRRFGGVKWASQFSSASGGFPGENDQNSPDNVEGNRSSPFSSTFQSFSQNRIPREDNVEGNRSSPFSSTFQSFSQNRIPRDDAGVWGNNRSMNFVKGIIEEEGRDSVGAFSFYRPNFETNAEIIHIKVLRNNTFVTVTDSKGNVKCNASSGCLSEMKGGPKLSRYAAEATAEHVGRRAKTMGLKSVVVKVNGFCFFKKKKQAILAFRDGFTNSRSDQNPIVYIEDTTRQAHNGCRRPRKRRV